MRYKDCSVANSPTGPLEKSGWDAMTHILTSVVDCRDPATNI